MPIDVSTLDAAARHWTGHPGRTDRRHRRRLRRVRRPQLRARALGGTGCSQHNIPWPTLESGRLDLSDDTFRQMARSLSRGCADARAAQRAVRDAAERSRGRQRWPQPHDPVGLPIADGPQSAEQHPIHLWPERVAARPDPAAARLWRRLCRLVAAGVRYCGGAVRRCCHAGGLPSGDPYLEFAKQAGAVPADATKETHEAEARAVQAMRAGRAIRDGGRSAGAAHRPAPDRRARSVAAAPRNLPRSSGAGPMRRSITPC